MQMEWDIKIIKMEKYISLIEKSNSSSEVKTRALYFINSFSETERRVILLCESDWNEFASVYQKAIIIFKEIGLKVRRFKVVVIEYNSVNSDGEGCTEEESLIDRYFLERPIN